MPHEGWLLVSKPLRVPFRDGSTVTVRDLVAGLPRELDLAYFGDPARPLRETGEVIPAAAMGYAPGLFAKVGVLASLLAPKRRRRGLHFFFTPNKLTSRVVAILRRLSPGRPVLQNVMSSHEIARHVDLLRDLDGIVVLSDHTRDVLVGAGLDPARVHRIYPGVEQTDAGADPVSSRRLLYAGDLDADVVDRLIAVAEVLTDPALAKWSLCVAARPKADNDSTHRVRLEQGVAALVDQQRAEVLGEVDDMHALMGGCSLQLFVASHVRNKVDLPLVLLEGMARGLGLVALDLPPVSEIFDAGARHQLRPGVRVPTGDPRVLAGEVRRVLSDPETLVGFAADARELVRREFSRDKMIQQYAALYAALATGS